MRYRPDIQWSKESWTHNIFRFWELLFGAPLKIKLMVSTRFDGKVAISQAHSFEGACSLFETTVRNLLRKRLPIKVWIPKLSPIGGLPMPLANYMFAIAFDAKANLATTEGSSPQAWSHTCTGSNLALVVGIGVNNGSLNTVTATYNGTSMVQQTKQVNSSANFGWQWVLKAPSTGAHNVSISLDATSGSDNILGVSASFTGVNQTTPTGVASGTNAKTITVTTQGVVSVLVDFYCETGSAETVVQGGSQTLLYAINENSSTATSAGASYQATTTITNYTASYTAAGSNPVIMIVELLVLGTTYTATPGYGQYALTGESQIVHKILTALVGFGQYALTGFAITLKFVLKWIFENKDNSNWTNQTKH